MTLLSETAGQDSGYYPSLTSLRGIFISMIVLFHIRDLFDGCFGSMLEPFYTYGGYLGNWFFFMLSGFLIGYAYREKIAENQLGFFRFFSRRLRKVYPLYFISNLYMLFFRLYTHMLPAPVDWKAPLKVVLTISFGWFENVPPYNQPAWFISILLQCWAVYYLVAKLSAKRPALYFSLLGGISLWGFLLILMDMQMPFCYMQNGEGFFNFFLGTGLCEVFRMIKNAAGPKMRFSICGGAAVVILALCGGYWYLSQPSVRSAGPVIALLANPVVIFCSLLLPPLKRLLEMPVLHQLGRISMSVYFWHSPVALTYLLIRNRLLFLDQLPMGIQFGIYWVVLLLISAVSYYAIECPLRLDGK